MDRTPGRISLYTDGAWQPPPVVTLDAKSRERFRSRLPDSLLKIRGMILQRAQGGYVENTLLAQRLRLMVWRKGEPDLCLVGDDQPVLVNWVCEPADRSSTAVDLMGDLWDKDRASESRARVDSRFVVDVFERGKTLLQHESDVEPAEPKRRPRAMRIPIPSQPSVDPGQ